MSDPKRQISVHPVDFRKMIPRRHLLKTLLLICAFSSPTFADDDPVTLRVAAYQPPFTPSAPVQRRLQSPPAKSKFLAVGPAEWRRMIYLFKINPLSPPPLRFKGAFKALPPKANS
jgi:hypothetical protein